MALSLVTRTSFNPNYLIYRGVLSVLFGFLALSWPGPALLTVAMMYGIYAFLDGFLAIGTGIERGRRYESWGLPIFEGILGLAAGVITLFWPGITLFVLSLCVGAWALMTGILEVMAAFQFRRLFPDATQGGRVALGVAGVLSITLGVIVFMRPYVGAVSLLALVASYALIFGALYIGLGMRLRKKLRTFETAEFPANRAA